jgi:hypothetical protein
MIELNQVTLSLDADRELEALTYNNDITCCIHGGQQCAYYLRSPC